MNKGLFSKILPHLIAVVIFLIVAVIYCKPVLDGKVVNQSDVIGWKGMAQQSFEFKEKYGHFPLWTNSLFSGMPAYTIAMEPTHDLSTIYLYNLINLWLPKPINFFFLACICFYFLCQVLRINPWVSIMASLAYAYASYDPVIIAVGHDTKMRAIALLPAVIGSMILILQRKYLWGAALLTLFFGFQIATQHLQVVYYTGIVIGFLVIAYLVFNWKKQSVIVTVTGLGIAAAAAMIGFFTFAFLMLPVREYATETMRGGRSELTQLTQASNQTKNGLDKDYAFNWSYGIGETLTLVVPGLYGGSNGGNEHSGSTEFTEKISELGVPEDQALQMINGYSYWGPQPSTSGTVYLGAVISFLFILGMVYLNTWHKWWILVATIFGIILAWGKNFAALNYFLFDYMPLYNKFRAPTIALIIPQFTFALTAALTVNQLITDEKKEAGWKKFRTASFIIIALAALLLMLYISFSYKGENDDRINQNFISMLSQSPQGGQTSPQLVQQAQSTSEQLMNAIESDRRSRFGTDLFRSLLFIAFAIALIGAYLKNRIKPFFLTICLLLLSSIDLLAVGRRYLNADTFVEAEQFEAAFIPTEADRQILADPAKPFRVFDQTDANGPFNSSRASYFHNNIGGYHPAKLGLYQDIIEYQLGKGNMEVYNMLNTKYFITANPSNGQPIAQLNPDAFGAAWLVKAIKMVPSANAEMEALSKTSLRDTAIVQQKFAQLIKPIQIADSSASIKVAEYLNDKITYDFNSTSDQFALFSEIYYPLGWNAYLDGKKTEYVKVNYVLRGMSIPAGKHKIEFKFEPQSYKFSNTLMLISSIIAYILLIVAMIWSFRKSKAVEANTK